MAGVQVASLYAKLGLDDSEFNKGMSGAQRQLEGAAERARGFGSVIQGVLSTAGGFLLAQGIGAVTGAVGGLVSGMISGNAEFERYETQFGVLLGSADAAKQRLADLAEFGAKTPFELPEVVRADKILQGFGLHAEETARRFGFAGEQIRTIAGDVAAGTGAGFEEISTYIGKFSSGATGEAIARFQELGIVTRKQLTEMGLEFSKSGELVSPLDKSMGVLLTAMKQKFGGMMDAQSATFEGMMSNLQDWVGQAMRTMGAPIFDALKENLSSLLQFLGSDTVKGAITGIGQGLAQGVSVAVGAVQGLIGVVGDLKGAFDALMSGDDVWDWIANIGEKLNLPPSIVDLWQSVGSAMMEMRNTAQILAPALEEIFYGAEPADALAAAMGALSENFGFVGAAMSVAQAATSDFGKALMSAANIAGIAVGTFETIRDIVGNTLAQAFRSFQQAGQVALAWLPGILDMAMARGQELAAIVSSLLVSAFANFGRIANAVLAILPGLVGDVMNVLSSLYDTVGTVLVGAFRILQPIAITVFQVIATAVETLAPKVASLSAAVSDTLATAFAVLQRVAIAVFTAIEPYIPAIQAAIAKLGEVVTGVLGAAFDWLSGFMRDTVIPMLMQLGDWLAANLPRAIDALAGFISGTLIPALQKAWAFIQQNVIPILSDLFTWLKTHLPTAIATLTDFWNTKLKPALEAVWAFIKDPLAPLLETLAKIVGVALMKAVEVMLAVWDKLQPAFKVVADFLAGTLSGLLSGLVTTFENLRGPIGWVNDRLREFKDALAGLSLPEWLQRHSPSPIEQTFAGLATMTPRATQTLRAFGAAAGALDAATLNVAAVESLAAAMRMLVQIMGAPGMGVEPGSNDEERINTMSEAIGRIVTAIKGVVDTIALIGSEAGVAAVAAIRDSRAALDATFDAILEFGRALAQRAGAAQAQYSETILAALQSLGDALQRINAAFAATISIVTTFLDEVNTPRFLGALGSVAARNWIADLVAIIVTWGAQIGDQVDNVIILINAEVTPKLRDLAALLDAATEALTTTVAAVQTLLDLVKAGVPTIDAEGAAQLVIRPLIAIAQGLATQIGLAMGAWSQVPPASAALSRIVQEGVGVLATTVEAIQTLFDLIKAGVPTIDAEGVGVLLIKPIILIAKGIAKAIQDALGAWQGADLPLAQLTQMVEGLVGVIDAVVATVARLVQPDIEFMFYGTPEETAAKILNAVGHMIDVVVIVAKRLADRIKAAVGTWKPSDVPLSALSSMVGDLVGVIDAVVATVTRLVQPDMEFMFYGTPEEVAAKILNATGHMIDVVIAVAKALAKRIQDAMGAWQPSELAIGELVSLIGDFGSLLGNVMDIFATLMQAVEDKIAWDDAEAQAVAERSVGVIIAFALRLAKAATTAMTDIQVTALPALAALGTVISDLGGLFGGVMDILRTFADAAADKIAYGEAAQAVVRAALLSLVLFAVKVAEQVDAVLDAYQAQRLVINAGLAKVKDAIGDIGSLLSGVFDILRVFAAVAADKVDYGEAAQAAIREALISLVIFAVYITDRVSTVMYLYQAQKLVINAGLSRIADALGDILSVLRDTLDISKLAGQLDSLDPARLGVLRDKLLAALPYLVQIAKDFAAQASAPEITEAWSKAAGLLADTMGSAVGAIRDALDLGGLLSNRDTVIPSPQQVAAKIGALLDVVDVAVSAFGARAAAAAASGLDVTGLASYAGAVKGVFEAIGEVAAAVQSFTGIYTGPGIGQSSGFANIKATLDQIFALFEDAARHADLVARVTSTITTALDGVTALASVKGADAGAAWLAGFAGAVGGMAMPQLAPAAAGGTGGGQVIINNIQNTSRSISVSISPSTAEAGRAGVMGVYSLVMY